MSLWIKNRRIELSRLTFISVIGVAAIFTTGCLQEEVEPSEGHELGVGLYTCDGEAFTDLNQFRSWMKASASCLERGSGSAEIDFRIGLKIPEGTNALRTVIISDGCSDLMREYHQPLGALGSPLVEVTDPPGTMNVWAPEKSQEMFSNGRNFRTGVYHVNYEFMKEGESLGIETSTMAFINEEDGGCLEATPLGGD
jgi:hypothetical protein